MARISITCGTENATIRYTTNGSEPTEASGVYSSPFIAEGITVKAKGFKSGLAPSAVASKAIPQENPVSWTTVSIGTTVNLFEAAYGNGRFVLVGNGVIFYSTDGKTWTQATQPLTGYIYSVAFGNGRFVTCGMSSASDRATQIAYSTDGVTWTAVSQSVVPKWGQRIGFGAGKFVISGWNTSNKTAMAYSTDGVTWYPCTFSGLTRYAYSFAYGAGKFIVCNGGGGQAYSTDGVTWTTITDNFKNAGLSSAQNIAYGNGLFVATNPSGGAAYSTDGITWATFTQSRLSNIYASFFGYGKFLFGGISSDGSGKYTIAYSRNGTTWQSTLPAYGTKIGGFAYGNGRFVLVGSSGLVAYNG